PEFSYRNPSARHERSAKYSQKLSRLNGVGCVADVLRAFGVPPVQGKAELLRFSGSLVLLFLYLKKWDCKNNPKA
ncbi:MAG: hypothetical protein LUD81_02510, partial [Clostridiales bacterium]|nr:hypothetical protein [Clostridiales bacterium]